MPKAKAKATSFMRIKVPIFRTESEIRVYNDHEEENKDLPGPAGAS